MIPMNMIPFIINMDNTSKVQPEPAPGPQPEPFNPKALLDSLFPLELQLEKIAETENNYKVTNNSQDIINTLFNEGLNEVQYSYPFRFTLNGEEYICIGHGLYDEQGTTISDLILANDPSGTLYWFTTGGNIYVVSDVEDPYICFEAGEIERQPE